MHEGAAEPEKVPAGQDEHEEASFEEKKPARQKEQFRCPDAENVPAEQGLQEFGSGCANAAEYFPDGQLVQ